MTAIPCGQQDIVGSSDVLWRKTRDHADHLEWYADLGCWLPRVEDPSNALQFNPDLSVLWADHLLGRHEILASSLVAGDEVYNLVFAVDVSAMATLKLRVEHTPTESTPVGCSHVSVWRPESLTKPQRKQLKYALQRLMRLVAGEVRRSVPEGA